MEEDLFNLIRTLEAEQATLQELKEAAVHEQDYLAAHHYNSGLGQVGRQLQILKNLEDPDYDTKSLIQRRHLYYKMLIDEAKPGHLKDFYDKELRILEEQLHNLHAKAQSQEERADEQILQKQIDLLLQNKTNSIAIALTKQANIRVQIIRMPSGLKILLSNLHSLNENRHESLKTKSKLQSLGFALSESEDEFIITLIGAGHEVKTKLIQLLARLIFEVYAFKDSTGKAIIISD